MLEEVGFITGPIVRWQSASISCTEDLGAFGVLVGAPDFPVDLDIVFATLRCARTGEGAARSIHPRQFERNVSVRHATSLCFPSNDSMPSSCRRLSAA